ncbi:sulfate adenylyltransferase subunit CysN [Lichenicoccus roseus]|uniref:Multifunctional fusion protein n=2 Tax=Lichenicoccus roseus TaxID=2683649 RepID=A0A5R9J644_9PROT|nr:sulfate adenylyltransferase subunit CysN [Lichenicoccus roseus]
MDGSSQAGPMPKPLPGNSALLRFLTCGSVDDGKSTLIGRLLYDTKRILADQMVALEKDSRRFGTTGPDLDLALLVDGLEAEREQGITIDVAYRYFATDRRSFIVADTPGHEQYTRNMATGASTADLAILLVDARHGIMTQTRRHAFIANLLGVRHLVLAVNKIDLVGYDQARFDQVAASFEEMASGFGFASVRAIPISARYGDNVTEASEQLAWYGGPTLLAHLEQVDLVDASAASGQPFRMPVQWVNRPDLDFRGYSGTVASGCIRPGDPIVVAGSGRESRVARIVTMDGDLARAGAGDAVTLTLADELDISRGDVFAQPDARPEVSDQFAARIVWMDDAPLLPGRSYLLKLGTRTVTASVSTLKHKVDINTYDRLAAKELRLNEIGTCNLSLASPIAFDPYEQSRTMGAFILIDRLTNRTAGAGMIKFGLRRATNIHRQATSVSKQARAAQNRQKPCVLWFTGLSGSGKSSISDLVERALHAQGHRTYLLDGDNIRHGLSRDLGFSQPSRVENIRRVGEVTKLFVDAGLIVLASFISPFRAERRMVRDMLEPGEFIEVFVDTPLEICKARDPKGLYRKALAGEITNFTGVDSPYEAPEQPELLLEGGAFEPASLAERVLDLLRVRGVIGSE